MAVMNQMKIIGPYVFIKSKNGTEKANKKTCVFIFIFFVLLCAISAEESSFMYKLCYLLKAVYF